MAASVDGSTPPSLVPKERDLCKRVLLLTGKEKKEKRGTLRFIGGTEFSEGIWCGVELDGPTGKNNGSVHGIRYFGCEADCGIFVPVANVKVDVSRPRRRPTAAPKPPNIKELVNRLSQPLRRTSNPASVPGRRKPMKASATKAGGMYNTDSMKDKDKMKPGNQKLPTKNRKNAGKSSSNSCSDILDSSPAPTSSSAKSSTTSSSSHTSLENYPWPRTSTLGNRDELTPDGCSNPEEPASDSADKGFLEAPQQLPLTSSAYTGVPAKLLQKLTTSDTVSCPL